MKPKVCDICHKLCGRWWVDGKTVHGPWATMCLTCHAEQGVGFGLGKGQKFDGDRKVQG